MEEKSKNVLSKSLFIVGLIVLAFAFFNTTGTRDVEIWLKWMDYAAQNGIRKGYELQSDMYPPLAIILQVCLKSICPALSDFQILRLVNIFFLILTVSVVQFIYQNIRVSLISFLGLMLSMNLGYLDIEMCPFLILAFYYFSKRRYVVSGVFFTLLCLVKFQPLVIMPYVCVFFVDIFKSEKHKLKIEIQWKELFKIALPAFLIGIGMLIIYQWPLLKALYRALFDSGNVISANALNLGWIVQFLLEKFHPEIYGSLDNGRILMIWNASGIHMQFRFIFVLVYILSVIFLLLAKKKSFKLLLKSVLVGYTAYFLYNTGVHENHLFLGMLLMILLYLEEPTENNYYKMVMYTLIFNVNLVVLYGISGRGPGYGRVVNDWYDPTLVIAIFNLIYLSISIYQFLHEIVTSQKESNDGYLGENSFKDRNGYEIL